MCGQGLFVALRFSNIMAPGDYRHFPSFWPNPQQRKWNLWGYVDERDVATACRLSLAAPHDAVAGSPSFIIAAADTVMNRPSADLLAEVFPDVGLTRDIGECDTLLAIDRAREVLGYQPATPGVTTSLQTTDNRPTPTTASHDHQAAKRWTPSTTMSPSSRRVWPPARTRVRRVLRLGRL